MAGRPYYGNTYSLCATVTPVTSAGAMIQVHDDARTAQSSAEMLRPAVVASTLFHWVRRGLDTTRIILFARQPVGATVTASPVVRVFGAYGLGGAPIAPDPTTGNFADDGSVRFVRLDNTAANAAGVTMLLSSGGSGLARDTSFAYSNPVPDLDGLDLKGCEWYGVMVQTAAAYSAGGAETPIFALATN